jgi:rhamnulokinase
MNQPLYIAVDLGAGSGRVFLVGMADEELLLEEVRRFQYLPEFRAGHLRWDLKHIFSEIKNGLADAAGRALALHRPVQSIGVDSWAVDYGLVDKQAKVLEDPICYRDQRTQDTMDQVFIRVPRAELFEHTGIQFLPFNTLFQLYAHTEEGLPQTAARLLLIPDLINFLLTGKAVCEYTNATTTQMLDVQTRDWDEITLNKLQLPAQLLPKIVPAGTDLGPLKQETAAELGLEGVHVIAPATHDTGSAVAGAPLREGWAYISSGTWSLVGVERQGALTNPEVARHNFTNEGGFGGTIRFLKNVMGLWILESCRREWAALGFSVDYQELLAEVEQIDRPCPMIFPDDPGLLNPASMLHELARQLNEHGERLPDNRTELAKSILDSLAFRYASVLRTIRTLTGQKIEGVHIVGGGSQNRYLNQATANATGLPVLAGPAEATVVGNAMVQAIAAGRFDSLATARQHVAANVRLQEFTPRPTPATEAAAQRYAAIEAGAQIRFEVPVVQPCGDIKSEAGATATGSRMQQ